MERCLMEKRKEEGAGRNGERGRERDGKMQGWRHRQKDGSGCWQLSVNCSQGLMVWSVPVRPDP